MREKVQGMQKQLFPMSSQGPTRKVDVRKGMFHPTRTLALSRPQSFFLLCHPCEDPRQCLMNRLSQSEPKREVGELSSEEAPIFADQPLCRYNADDYQSFLPKTNLALYVTEINRVLGAVRPKAGMRNSDYQSVLAFRSLFKGLKELW